MKIAYLVYHDIASNDGVCKKIQGQISAWEKLGHEVLLLCLVSNKAETTLPALQYECSSLVQLHFGLSTVLLNDIDNFSPDFVYLRYDLWNRTFESVLKRYRTILELNTIDVYENWVIFKTRKTLKSCLRLFGNLLLRSRILKNAVGFVGVTNEIIEHPTIKKFQKPSICIPNSIDLDRFSLVKKTRKNDNDRVGFFFMGSSGQEWHGVDYIVEMSYNFPNYDFHIVGTEGDNTKNLLWHGFLRQDEYLKILDTCHICIGTLALYRKGMEEACPLKVREYLAYGFPTILGFRDSAFFTISPNWITYVDTRKKIDYIELGKFIESNKNTVVSKEDIMHISTEYLEKKRCDFFSAILEEKAIFV